MKSNDELKQTSPELYRVAREKGTEYPHTGKYIHTKSQGIYHCAVCDAQLFNASTQFNCGSGWPAFTQAIDPQAVELAFDASHGMRRTEVTCQHCNAHLGHVFSDGPDATQHPLGTGERFCINSISLILKEDTT